MLQIRIDMPAVHARIPLDVADNWCPQAEARFQAARIDSTLGNCMLIENPNACAAVILFHSGLNC